MNRKQFIASSSAALLLGNACQSQPKFLGKRLVIIRLMGGMDAYHFIAPKNNEIFQLHRSQLYRKLNTEGIAFEKDWLINPQFDTLANLINTGNLTIIPQVGFDDYNSYSHFTAERYWETGELVKYEEGRIENSLPTGWIGRLGDQNKLIAIGSNIKPVITLDNYSSLFDHGEKFQGIIYEGINPTQNYIPLMQEWMEAQSNSNTIIHRLLEDQINQLSVTMKFENQMVDRKNFVGKLRQVKEIIEKDLPFRVIHLSQDGYDTHANQKPRIEPLFGEVMDGLNLLYQFLRKSKKLEETLVFVYSEFGRSIETNDSGGTDHGKANLAFMMSGSQTLANFEYPFAPIQTFQVGRHHYVKHTINYQEIQHKITDWLI